MNVTALMEVRTALSSTANTTGGDTRTGVGGVEIQKMIDSLFIETFNNGTDLRPRVARKQMNQAAFIWNLKTSRGSTSKASFYAEGGTGTPYPDEKIQLVVAGKSLRSDYEVTGFMEAATTNFYAALADEARDAINEMNVTEEKAFIAGFQGGGTTADTAQNDYSVGSSTLGYKGLYQLMGNNAVLGDTDTVYGTARNAAKVNNALDCQVTATNTNGSTAALTLKNLDTIWQLTRDQEGTLSNQIWFCSTARENEINQLLQPQQRFNANVGQLSLEGGFIITTYRGIPIIGSRFMDQNGIIRTGGSTSRNDADACIYLLDMRNLEFRNVGGIDGRHIPIMGTDASQRSDVKGGYFKTYGVVVLKKFNTQGIIYNLTAP